MSVYPASSAQKISSPSTTTLQAANGTSIKTFGRKTLSLCFQGLRVKHEFLLADIHRPILGTDFFRANALLIDIAGRRLFRPSPLSCGDSVVHVRAKSSKLDGRLCGLRCSLPPDTVAVDRLFSEFPAVTSPPVYDATPPKHGVFHTVPTTGPPVFARARRLFGDKLDVARAEFDKMVQMGIIRPSNSAWASPPTCGP